MVKRIGFVVYVLLVLSYSKAAYTDDKLLNSVYFLLLNTGQWNISDPLPQFVTSDFTERNKIGNISKFRSGVGHDYSDEYESCRSMKHYYLPNVPDWTTISVFSPVNGQVVRLEEGWAGSQVHIKSNEYPSFTFVLFHVSLISSLENGSYVSAGQKLGYHASNSTYQDIAVRVTVIDGNEKMKLVSFFEVMTNSLFSTYSDFSTNRADFIISKKTRDYNPMICNGEAFLTSSSLPNWVK